MPRGSAVSDSPGQRKARCSEMRNWIEGGRTVAMTLDLVTMMVCRRHTAGERALKTAKAVAV